MKIALRKTLRLVKKITKKIRKLKAMKMRMMRMKEKIMEGKKYIEEELMKLRKNINAELKSVVDIMDPILLYIHISKLSTRS